MIFVGAEQSQRDWKGSSGDVGRKNEATGSNGGARESRVEVDKHWLVCSDPPKNTAPNESKISFVTLLEAKCECVLFYLAQDFNSNSLHSNGTLGRAQLAHRADPSKSTARTWAI